MVKPIDSEEFFARVSELGLYWLTCNKTPYALPQFDGITALAMAREKCPDAPFVFVSGVIGEELAIESLKKGATDYVRAGRRRDRNR